MIRHMGWDCWGSELWGRLVAVAIEAVSLATAVRRYVKEKTVGHWRDTARCWRTRHPAELCPLPSYQPPWMPSYVLISQLSYHLFAFAVSYLFSTPVPFILLRR